MSARTPRPWAMKLVGDTWYVRTEDGRVIEPRDRDQGERIVRAVNAHAALVDALRDLTLFVADVRLKGKAAADVLERARAALAQAGVK